ncbi:hypothetical protein M514_02909 [Trichuris suis]|uniref:Uncharacterized protein n=1 Tax=Trichuris suis TaxID=68888 RepID=A0A085NB09_9BILA|nr:hypothetical protein M514_02909 [Trichuris suis]
MVMLTDLLMPWRLCRRFRDRLLPWSLSDVRCSTRSLFAQSAANFSPDQLTYDGRSVTADDNTEEELNRMQSSVACMLNRISGSPDDVPSCPEEECVVCLTNRASLQTFPCGHMVLCRKCFVKTVQLDIAAIAFVCQIANRRCLAFCCHSERVLGICAQSRRCDLYRPEALLNRKKTMEETGRKWTSYQLFLAFLMVSTGTLNTLAAKWADMLYSLGRPFSHPFLQSLCMFIGEFSCLPTFLLIKYIRNRRRRSVDFASDETQLDASLDERPKFNVLIFLPATLCDMTATSIMYVGLTMTNASSFQMLRGATIIFTGIFSVAFLGMTLKLYKWLGMLLVLCGLVIVGLSDLLFADISGDSADPKRMISGDLLILIAQIIIALQMVYEQRFVNKYNVPPLLVVGLEGLFGCILMTIICVCFYFVKAQPPFTIDPEMRLENVPFAFRQIAANNLILFPILGLIVSIAFFNFAGISVTKEIDAPTRMVLDSVRVFFIWAVSLLAGWQYFVLMQLGGFFVLLFGMVVYNDIFLRQFIISKLKRPPRETATVPSEEQS